MIRELNENEIQYLGSGYKLLKDKIQVRYIKNKLMNGIYKVWSIDDDIEKENTYKYTAWSIQELKGMFDGYFKGLNKVFGDTRG